VVGLCRVDQQRLDLICAWLYIRLPLFFVHCSPLHPTCCLVDGLRRAANTVLDRFFSLRFLTGENRTTLAANVAIHLADLVRLLKVRGVLVSCGYIPALLAFISSCAFPFGSRRLPPFFCYRFLLEQRIARMQLTLHLNSLFIWAGGTRLRTTAAAPSARSIAMPAPANVSGRRDAAPAAGLPQAATYRCCGLPCKTGLPALPSSCRGTLRYAALHARDARYRLAFRLDHSACRHRACWRAPFSSFRAHANSLRTRAGALTVHVSNAGRDTRTTAVMWGSFVRAAFFCNHVVATTHYYALRHSSGLWRTTRTPR